MKTNKKLKKNDTVIILAGKDKGRTGKILEILHEKNRVLVEGINMVKHHQKARKEGQKGSMIDKAMPLHISNVSLVEGGKAVKASFKIDGNKKTRVSKKTGKTI